jgi:arylsulfatase A-like enzyme
MNQTASGFFSKLLCAALLALFPSGILSAQTNALRKMPPPAPRRPSIILILADNIGYGDLGCYGQTKIKTPNLDKLAAGGARFTSFYAGSPDDAPSRAALMTGFEPRHLRAGFNEVLPADALTIAQFLKQQGYYTGLIGEWNLGDTGPLTPDKKGFDDFAGFLNANHARDYFTDRVWRHDPTRSDTQMIFSENENGKHGAFMPDMLTTAATNFVRIHKPELLNQHRPFFLCLSYPIPHVTVSASPPGNSPYADVSWPPMQRIRASLISRMDDGIGKLMDELDKLNIATNTVVIFTSIGGPENEKNIGPEFFNSAGPLRGSAGSVYEGGIRVPMIVRWPARIKAGQTSDFACAAWDLFPTAAEIALAKPPGKLDGVSMLPALEGKRQKNTHKLFEWESKETGAQAARMDDWKMVRTNSAAAFELYDLRNDIGEKQNVAEKNSSELKKIRSALGTTK